MNQEIKAHRKGGGGSNTAELRSHRRSELNWRTRKYRHTGHELGMLTTTPVCQATSMKVSHLPTTMPRQCEIKCVYISWNVIKAVRQWSVYCSSLLYIFWSTVDAMRLLIFLDIENHVVPYYTNIYIHTLSYTHIHTQTHTHTHIFIYTHTHTYRSKFSNVPVLCYLFLVPKTSLNV